MNALHSADPQLSNAATSIKIGSRVWKIGDTIYSQGKMVETFGDQYATAQVEGVIVGKGATKKVRVRWTNLKVPKEMEYGFQHSLFKDQSAPPRKKQQKSGDISQKAPLQEGDGSAGPNTDDFLELYPSDPEVSEDENQDGGSAGIDSLIVGGNVWQEESALDTIDPRSLAQLPILNPSFYFPPSIHARDGRDMIEYVDLFFHNQLFSSMVEHTNTNISDDSAKVTLEEMRRFVGIMFAMSVTPMNNIKEY
jgi:hypothetical protein